MRRLVGSLLVLLLWSGCSSLEGDLFLVSSDARNRLMAERVGLESFIAKAKQELKLGETTHSNLVLAGLERRERLLIDSYVSLKLSQQ